MTSFNQVPLEWIPPEQYREEKSKAENLLLSLLPTRVVSGRTKDNYRTQCFIRKDGSKGVFTKPREDAIYDKYLRYATTFKRNGIKEYELINCFIVDIDYKFVSRIEDAHNFSNQYVVPATFVTETDKGYQFIYALNNSIALTDKGEWLANRYNSAIINAFLEMDIEIDMTASKRLSGTFRNPLVHNFKFNDVKYNLDRLDDLLAWHFEDERKTTATFSAASTNERTEKAKEQKKIIDAGFIDGNKNNYFYLMANREMVISGATTQSEFIMRCRKLAEQFNTNEISISDIEVTATARKLYDYKSKNQLFMPSVFATKQTPNAGKYRLEINAKLGYSTVQERRSLSAQLVARDKRQKTIQTIQQAIYDLPLDEWELEKKQGVNTIFIKVSIATKISVTTIKRYHEGKEVSLSKEVNNVLRPNEQVDDNLEIQETITEYSVANNTEKQEVEVKNIYDNSVVVENMEKEAINNTSKEIVRDNKPLEKVFKDKKMLEVELQQRYNDNTLVLLEHTRTTAKVSLCDEYKSKGLYLNGTELIVYQQDGELTEQRMMYFLKSVVTGAAHIDIENNFMDRFYDYTTAGSDYVLFDFYLLPYRQEHKIIPLMKSDIVSDLKKYTFCVTDDGIVHNLEISTKMIHEQKEKAHIELLESIASYEHNPNNFLDGFYISTFADKHFGKLKNVSEIKQKFKELAQECIQQH